MTLRKALTFALAFVFIFRPIHAGAADSGRLYLLPNFRDPALAESALALIRCAFERGSVLVEIVESRAAGYPLLELTESEGGIIALLRRNSAGEEKLGTHSPAGLSDALCEKITEGLAGAPPPAVSLAPASADSTPLANTSVQTTEQKNFFAKNWPYFAAAGAVLGGFLLARSLSGKSESPPRNESRGYVVR